MLAMCYNSLLYYSIMIENIGEEPLFYINMLHIRSKAQNHDNEPFIHW